MLALSSRPAAQARPLGADPESFRVFYAEALPVVYGYLLNRCGGSAHVAEDLTQETFVAAVAELHKGRRVDVPVAWVLGIARHKLLDHYRRQARAARTRTPAGVELDELPVESGEAARRAVAALAQVPAAQRAALVLTHLDGFSAAEAAQALGRSVEAVESLLARGRASFRRAYEGEA